MMTRYDNPENWYSCRQDCCKCVRCGNEKKGIFYISQNTGICLECAISDLAAGIVHTASSDGIDLAEFIESIDSTPQKAGLLQAAGTVHDIVVLKGDDTAASKLNGKLSKLIGEVSNHPLSHLLRSFAVYSLIKHENIILPTLITLADEIVSGTGTPHTIQTLYNLALILSYTAPYNKSSRKLIALAIETAEKKSDIFVIQWFKKEYGYFFPRMESFRTNNIHETLLQDFKLQREIECRKLRHGGISELESVINKQYSLKQLKSIFREYAEEDLISIKEIRKPVKADYIRIFAKRLSDKKLFLDFYNSLPEWMRNALAEVVKLKSLIPLNDLKSSAGIKIIDHDDFFYYGDADIPDEFSIFQIWVKKGYKDINKRTYLYLDSTLADIMLHHIIDPDKIPVEYRDSPQEGLMISDNTGILEQISVIPVYHRQIGFEKSKNGKKYLKSTFNSIRKLCTVPEPYSGIKGLSELRISMLLNLVEYFLYETKTRFTDPENFLKDMFNYYFSPESTISRNFGWTLDFLKLKTWRYLENKQDIYREERRIIQEILSLMERGKWISVNDIYTHLRSRGITLRSTYYDLKYSNISFLSNNNGMDYSSDRIYVNNINAGMILELPYLKALLFVLNTIGAVSAAYTTPENKLFNHKSNPWLSVYDGMKEISITPIGEWLTGKIETIEKEKTESSSRIILDDKRLIVKLEGTNTMAELLLTRIALPLGSGNYLVSYESFLNNCESHKDIEREIELFREILSGSPPPVWEDFFKTIINNSNPLSPEPENFYLLKIKKKNRSIIGVINNDPYLRSHIIKAEDYRIIINSKFYNSVRNKLSTYGFLLPKK